MPNSVFDVVVFCRFWTVVNNCYSETQKFEIHDGLQQHIDALGASGVSLRAVVVLRPEQYDDWLKLNDPEQARWSFGLLPVDQLAIRGAAAAWGEGRDRRELAH